ncbi:hypothetical protein CRG98_038383, partial [Punica granatum]
EVDHPGSLRGVEGCPNLQGAGLFFGAHVDLLCWLDRVRGEAMKMVALAGLDDLMTGRAKAESPPVFVLLDLNGAADPLSACP